MLILWDFDKVHNGINVTGHFSAILILNTFIIITNITSVKIFILSIQSHLLKSHLINYNIHLMPLKALGPVVFFFYSLNTNFNTLIRLSNPCILHYLCLSLFMSGVKNDVIHTCTLFQAVSALKP